MEQSDDGKFSVPPYIAYRTFLNFLTKLEQAIPRRIDRSYWSRYYNGSVGSQLVSALRFLGLVEGEDNRTTQDLARLVREKAIRKELLKEMLRKRFDTIFADVDDLSSVTHGQLEQSFKQHYKIEGESRRKAISFFVHAAQDAEIPISPFIRVNTNPRPSRSTSKPILKKKQQSKTPPPVNVSTAAPELDTVYTTLPQPDTTNGHTKTIMLRRNDSLSIIYTGDVLNMDKYDRELLFRLIDLLDSHAQEIPDNDMYDRGMEDTEEVEQ